MTSSWQHALNLVELPIDILGIILQPLLTENEAVSICACRDGRTIPNLSRHALTTLLIHPSLYAIGRPILYNTNEFQLDLTGSHGTHVRKALEVCAALVHSDGTMTVNANDQDAMDRDYSAQQMRDIGLLRVFAEPQSRKKISRLQIRLDKLRGWVQDLIVPMLTDMVMHGNLVDLSFSIEYRATHTNSVNGRKRIEGHSPQKDHQQLKPFTLPPVQGILAVLSDPYLRRARLFVSVSHSAEWCGFHGANIHCGGTESDRVEIDWRRILDQLDSHRLLSFE